MPLALGALMFVGFDPTALTADLSVVQEKHATTTQDLIAIATSTAVKHGLTAKQTKQMLATIQCESNWDNEAVGPMGEVGLIQFHPPSHKYLTKYQMKDVYFQLDWMAERFKEGVASKHWTCYRLLYGKVL